MHNYESSYNCLPPEASAPCSVTTVSLFGWCDPSLGCGVPLGAFWLGMLILPQLDGNQCVRIHRLQRTGLCEFHCRERHLPAADLAGNSANKLAGGSQCRRFLCLPFSASRSQAGDSTKAITASTQESPSVVRTDNSSGKRGLRS